MFGMRLAWPVRSHPAVATDNHSQPTWSASCQVLALRLIRPRSDNDSLSLWVVIAIHCRDAAEHYETKHKYGYHDGYADERHPYADTKESFTVVVVAELLLVYLKCLDLEACEIYAWYISHGLIFHDNPGRRRAAVGEP